MKYIAVIGCLLFFVRGFSQTIEQPNQTIVEMLPGEDILDMANVGQHSLIIKTGKRSTSKQKELKFRLHKLDSNLGLKWSFSLPTLDGYVWGNYTVTSESNNYTYFIQNGYYHLLISQVDENKKTLNTYNLIYPPKGVKDRFNGKNAFEKKEIKLTEDIRKHLIAAFIDEGSLFILMISTIWNTQKQIEEENLPKCGSELVLIKIAHDSGKLEELITGIKWETRERNNFGSAGFDTWEYLGHNNSQFFLAKKELDLSSNTHKYKVIVLNKNGKQEGARVIETTTRNTPIPLVNIRNLNGAKATTKDYSLIIGGNNAVSYRYIPDTGSFGCFYFDEKEGMFYMYGLTEKKSEDSRIANSYGFYVKQFNFFTGELLRDIERELPKVMSDALGLEDDSKFYSKAILFDLLTKDVVRLGLTSTKLGFASKNEPESYGIVVDLQQGKWTYANMMFPFEKKGEAMVIDELKHTKHGNCLVHTKFEQSQSYDNFLTTVPKFKTKEFDVFGGVVLGNKRVVVKDYRTSGSNKIELIGFKFKISVN